MKVDVLRFQYRRPPDGSVIAQQAMIAESRRAGHEVDLLITGNALVHASRNKAIAQARKDADFLLFCDDDMVPQPDALMRLMAHSLPAVSGLFTTRVEPVRYTFKLWDPAAEQFVPPPDLEHLPDGLLEGKWGLGAAFLLLSRAALDRVLEFWLSAEDWALDNRRLFDRLHVRSELREREKLRVSEARRLNFQTDGYLRLFDFPVQPNERQLGEDLAFSRLMIRAGVGIAIDTDVVVGHMGDYAFGPFDIGYGEGHDYSGRNQQRERR